jgi:dephospho-CoA kinase
MSRARATPRARLPRLPTSLARPIAVAITGGIGAGKSEALDSFRRHGAATVSSDEIVHRLLREDPVVGKTLVERFGDRILDEAGQIDRSAFAEIVFADREALDWLESLLHPLVVQEYLEWREQLAALPNPPPLTATEVPLLYEVGGQDRFDAVVVVTAPAKVRAGRTEVATEEREPRLLPDTVKIAQADFAYVNDGSLEELDAFVAEVMRELTAGAG